MMVTPLYAGLLVLWFLVLSIRVIRRRGSGGIALRDGGDPGMLRVIRGHANFAEYVPLALLLMAILELSRFSIYVLHALAPDAAGGATAARLYALSFTQQFKFGRMAGAGLTFIVLFIEALLCVYQAILAYRLW